MGKAIDLASSGLVLVTWVPLPIMLFTSCTLRKTLRWAVTSTSRWVQGESRTIIVWCSWIDRVTEWCISIHLESQGFTSQLKWDTVIPSQMGWTHILCVMLTGFYRRQRSSDKLEEKTQIMSRFWVNLLKLISYKQQNWSKIRCGNVLIKLLKVLESETTLGNWWSRWWSRDKL